MTNTTQSNHDASGTAADIASIFKGLQGSPIMGSLAQLFANMARANTNSETATTNPAAMETTATAETTADVAENAGENAEEAISTGETDDDDKQDDVAQVACRSSDGIFTDDEIASLMVGFVAGAAVVGGGCLLYKLLKD